MTNVADIFEKSQVEETFIGSFESRILDTSYMGVPVLQKQEPAES